MFVDAYYYNSRDQSKEPHEVDYKAFMSNRQQCDVLYSTWIGHIILLWILRLLPKQIWNVGQFHFNPFDGSVNNCDTIVQVNTKTTFPGSQNPMQSPLLQYIIQWRRMELEIFHNVRLGFAGWSYLSLASYQYTHKAHAMNILNRLNHRIIGWIFV